MQSPQAANWMARWSIKIGRPPHLHLKKQDDENLANIDLIVAISLCIKINDQHNMCCFNLAKRGFFEC